MAFWSRPAAVGLDIGSRLVKVVQLKKTGKKKIELEKFGVTEIYPSGEKPASLNEQRAAIVGAIKRVMEEADITADQVVTAVAGEAIIVRYIQLPEMPESELANALRWEAEEYIPFQIDEVNIDSAIIGHYGEGQSQHMDILLVCARKDLINDHVELLKEAGLGLSIVDVDSFAFLNCFDLNYSPASDEVIGLINIGGDITTISVFMDGMPRFSRDISIGGNTVSTAIQQRLGISFSEAEALKIERGVLKPDSPAEGAPPAGGEGGGEMDLMETIRSTVESMTGDAPEEDVDSRESQADRAIRNTLGNLTGEIRRSIQFFENQSRGLTVKRLVIGGGSASFRDLDDYLNRELDLDIEVIDPLLRIPITGSNIDADKLLDSRNFLSVGIGLALRKVVD